MERFKISVYCCHLSIRSPYPSLHFWVTAFQDDMIRLDFKVLNQILKFCFHLIAWVSTYTKFLFVHLIIHEMQSSCSKRKRETALLKLFHVSLGYKIIHLETESWQSKAPIIQGTSSLEKCEYEFYVAQPLRVNLSYQFTAGYLDPQHILRFFYPQHKLRFLHEDIRRIVIDDFQ